MIDALIMGRLHTNPTVRISKSGNPFVAAKVLVHVYDGTNAFIDAYGFDEGVIDALKTLEEGDSVALAGELRPSIYEPEGRRATLNIGLLVHRVMTAYSVSRKRKAQAKGSEAGKPRLDCSGNLDHDDDDLSLD